MKRGTLLGILALLPAALNVTPAHAGTMSLLLCTGDGLVRSVTVPVPARGEIPGSEQPGCCAKGCHTGSRKKCFGRQIDPRQ